MKVEFVFDNNAVSVTALEGFVRVCLRSKDANGKLDEGISSLLTKSEARALGSALMGCAAELGNGTKITSEVATSRMSEDLQLGHLLREYATEMEHLLPDHDVMKGFRKTLRQILKK